MYASEFKWVGKCEFPDMYYILGIFIDENRNDFFFI